MYYIIHETRMGGELGRYPVKSQDALVETLKQIIDDVGTLEDGDIFRIEEKE